jgi:hypothetical protein
MIELNLLFDGNWLVYITFLRWGLTRALFGGLWGKQIGENGEIWKPEKVDWAVRFWIWFFGGIWKGTMGFRIYTRWFSSSKKISAKSYAGAVHRCGLIAQGLVTRHISWTGSQVSFLRAPRDKGAKFGQKKPRDTFWKSSRKSIKKLIFKRTHCFDTISPKFYVMLYPSMCLPLQLLIHISKLPQFVYFQF